MSGSAWGLSWWRSWANAWGSVLVELPPRPEADRFDWNAPRLLPGQATPAMQRVSQRQWLQRMRRPR